MNRAGKTPEQMSPNVLCPYMHRFFVSFVRVSWLRELVQFVSDPVLSLFAHQTSHYFAWNDVISAIHHTRVLNFCHNYGIYCQRYPFAIRNVA